ncbi:MAG: nucleotide exchange factor GrpE [Firmicutes bacterium]|nr:nucleotide exchange factor GrpE [Bacillota bacterium]
MPVEEAKENQETNEAHDQTPVNEGELPGESGDAAGLSEEQLRELVDRLTGELDASKQRVETYYRRLLRMEADFDNFRRRARAEKEEIQLHAAEKVITGLLPVLDNLERALEAVKNTHDIEALIQGLEMVHRGFKDILDREGLKVMEVLGRDFDPEMHEAMAQVPAAEAETPDNTIVREFQKGYLLRGKVIRPARVAVAKEVSPESGDADGQ